MDCADVSKVAAGIPGVTKHMGGLYGISECGIRLQSGDGEPMSQVMASMGQAPMTLLTGQGALLGAAGAPDTISVVEAHGVYAAVEADLTNIDALRRECELAPEATAAQVVACQYQRHGLRCLETLDGGFAVVLWDPELERLVLAVDRHGFRTLYWMMEGSRLLFSSSITAIESVMRQRAEVDPAAIMQFLVHTVVPAPLTVYKGIRRLEAGTQLTYQRGRLRETRYWNLSYKESAKVNIPEWREELRECMRQAVHSQLTGCDPRHIGAYLSGGTDSSSIVAFASEQLSPVNSFSIYFEDPRYDEIDFARTAASHFRTQHYEKCLNAADAAEAIPKIVEYYEEPFANSSAIGAYYCARLARDNGMDMLLAGDGGDELFGGNERYAADKKFAMYGALPKALQQGIKVAANLLPQVGPLSLPGRYIRRAEVPNPKRMFSYNFFLTAQGIESLDPDFAAQARPEGALEIAQGHFDSAPHATSELNRLLYLDVKMTLSDNDLRKVIGTAELAGMRVRFPLLDRRLAELSGRIPSILKLRGFKKRYIFKEAMKGILPAKILYKKKHGFGVPVGYWLISDPRMKSLAAILDEPRTRQRGYFRPGFIDHIKELTRIHPAYFGEVLWGALMLELWHRRSEGSWSDRSVLTGIGAERAR